MSNQLILPCDASQVSDGFHTFQELYEHRHALFILLCTIKKGLAWKSWKHDDGSGFDGWFIAGLQLEDGMITYHLPEDLWEHLRVQELDRVPKWDGHTPQDVVDRIYDEVNFINEIPLN